MNDAATASPEARKLAADRYAAMDRTGQALLLVCITNRLSLLARDTYEIGDWVSDSARLRPFSQALNTVLAQLERVLACDPRRYPDEVFASIPLEQCETLRVDPEALLAAAGMPQTAAPSMSPGHRRH
jgi:hypothetical protein